MSEQSAFEQFFKTHYDKAYFFALRILRHEEASRDVVAEAFMHVWDKAGHTEADIKRMAPYLLTTIRNLCICQLRKRQTADRYAQMELHTLERFDETEVTLLQREQRMQEVMKALELLTPRTRSVIVACYVERKKYKEVAAELGISESAVKKHMMQALSFLRQKFKNVDI